MPGENRFGRRKKISKLVGYFWKKRNRGGQPFRERPTSLKRTESEIGWKQVLRKILTKGPRLCKVPSTVLFSAPRPLRIFARARFPEFAWYEKWPIFYGIHNGLLKRKNEWGHESIVREQCTKYFFAGPEANRNADRSFLLTRPASSALPSLTFPPLLILLPTLGQCRNSSDRFAKIFLQASTPARRSP